MAIGLVTSMLLLTKTVTLADIVDSGGLCLGLGRRCELTGKAENIFYLFRK